MINQEINKEILNSIQNIKFKDIKQELNNILLKYGLKIPYDFEKGTDEIRIKFIDDEIKKANIHNIEVHNFDKFTLSNIDELQRIKEIINNHFSQLSNNDKLKECMNNLNLKEYKRINKEEFEKYGLKTNKEDNFYWGRVYKMDNKNNIISFSFSAFEKESYGNKYKNYYNDKYIRHLKFIIKHFLNINWETQNDIKTYMREEDFNKWIKIEDMEFKVFKNGRVDIKHKKVKNIYNAYEKDKGKNYIFL